ncbi:MAG: hypothetical protein V7L11_27410 [Nostoc sp.]|uniref:hypothetical protein n=1 Tax=Nostoc sp. TaxID=1180 RepID=UPI002FF6D063
MRYLRWATPTLNKVFQSEKAFTDTRVYQKRCKKECDRFVLRLLKRLFGEIAE